MRVVVLGARGQLGAAIVHEFSPHHETIAVDRAALDITDAVAAEGVLARARPEAIINCVAYNAVDAAEDHPVDALACNALAVRTLAREAARHHAVLVHYGTDFVFDGTATSPYTEDDRPNPRGVYAASKLLGEWFAADAPRAYVLRVESLFGDTPGGPASKGSVAGIVQALGEGTRVKVFEDRTVTPTHVADAAMVTRALVERGIAPGLYHCVSSGSCTWLELAEEAARQLGVEPRFEPVRLADMKLKAPRPLYCALSNEKLLRAGIALPSWQDALARYLKGGTV